MSLDILQEDIKTNNIRNIYIFTGPEEYLKSLYFSKIESAILEPSLKGFNKIVLENKQDETSIIRACESMPAFSNKKLIVVKNSGLFKSSKDSGKGNKLTEYLEKMPEYNCLIFYEESIDKRLKIINVIKKRGLIVDFQYKTPAELSGWIVKMCNNFNKQIDTRTASIIVEYSEPDMYGILREIEKLISFVGDNPKITDSDVKSVCIKTIKSRIFDLTDAISKRDIKSSIRLFDDMVSIKEPIPKIMFMIIKHFRQMLQVKILREEGLNLDAVTKHMGIAPYAAKKLFYQSEQFSKESLKKIVEESLNSDVLLKTGQAKPKTVFEMFLINFLNIL